MLLPKSHHIITYIKFPTTHLLRLKNNCSRNRTLWTALYKIRIPYNPFAAIKKSQSQSHPVNTPFQSQVDMGPWPLSAPYNKRWVLLIPLSNYKDRLTEILSCKKANKSTLLQNVSSGCSQRDKNTQLRVPALFTQVLFFVQLGTLFRIGHSVQDKTRIAKTQISSFWVESVPQFKWKLNELI